MKELQEKINQICSEIFEMTGVKVTITVTEHPVWKGWLFSVESDTQFTFWKNFSNPLWWIANSEENFLSVVPGNHPCIDDDIREDAPGKKRLLINGATEAYISGDSIKAIYAPSFENDISNLIGYRWSSVKHAYKATGCDFKFTTGLDFNFDELAKEIFDVIYTALGKSKEYAYISVSGGFDCRKYFNTTYNEGRTVPGRIRGSEYKNMEMIDFLREEGTLENAYIPKWFKEEGWIEFYENATNIESLV